MSFQDFRIRGDRVVQIDSDGTIGYKFPNEGGTSGQVMVLDADNTTLNFGDVAGGAARVKISDNPPENPARGDLWYDTLDDFTLYTWYDSEGAWIDVTSSKVSSVNRGIVTLSDNPPSNPEEGELWYDTGTNLRLFVWSDIAQAWIDASPGGSGGGSTTTTDNIKIQGNVPDPLVINGDYTLIADGTTYSLIGSTARNPVLSINDSLGVPGLTASFSERDNYPLAVNRQGLAVIGSTPGFFSLVTLDYTGHTLEIVSASGWTNSGITPGIYTRGRGFLNTNTGSDGDAYRTSLVSMGGQSDNIITLQPKSSLRITLSSTSSGSINASAAGAYYYWSHSDASNAGQNGGAVPSSTVTAPQTIDAATFSDKVVVRGQVIVMNPSDSVIDIRFGASLDNGDVIVFEK